MYPSWRIALLALTAGVLLSVAMGWLSRRVYIDPAPVSFVVVLGCLVAWSLWNGWGDSAKD